MVGLVISVVATWGAFIAMWSLGGMEAGSMELNAMAAATIASTIVAVIMFAIMLIPIIGQIIAAIIGLIDAVIALICSIGDWEETTAGEWICGGITGLAAKVTEWVIYGGTIMVDMEDENRLTIQNYHQVLFDPNLGISVGNAYVSSAAPRTGKPWQTGGSTPRRI